MGLVQDHYENHLSHFYRWMMGDFETRVQEQEFFFREHAILTGTTKQAIDLGSGHGIQSIALARLGFTVTAVDFSRVLLDELKENAGQLPVKTAEQDILQFKANEKADVVLCMGDTLSHLDNLAAVEQIIQQAKSDLVAGGKIILSFRDLSSTPADINRFIPVRSDANRILTCFLEDRGEFVRVSDILHTKTGDEWKMTVSSYPKIKIPDEWLQGVLRSAGFRVEFVQTVRGLITLIASF